MQYFTHFKNGEYVSESTYRKPDYMAGEFEDIFDRCKVVVDLSSEEIRDALCDGELLGKIGVSQAKVEKAYESLP